MIVVTNKIWQRRYCSSIFSSLVVISEVEGTIDNPWLDIITLLFVMDITLIIVKQPSLKITLNLMHTWTQGDYFTKHIKTSNWVIR